jgi:hypothetical protein
VPRPPPRPARPTVSGLTRLPDPRSTPALSRLLPPTPRTHLSAPAEACRPLADNPGPLGRPSFPGRATPAQQRPHRNHRRGSLRGLPSGLHAEARPPPDPRNTSAGPVRIDWVDQQAPSTTTSLLPRLRSCAVDIDAPTHPRSSIRASMSMPLLPRSFCARS